MKKLLSIFLVAFFGVAFSNTAFAAEDKILSFPDKALTAYFNQEIAYFQGVERASDQQIKESDFAILLDATNVKWQDRYKHQLIQYRGGKALYIYDKKCEIKSLEGIQNINTAVFNYQAGIYDEASDYAPDCVGSLEYIPDLSSNLSDKPFVAITLYNTKLNNQQLNQLFKTTPNAQTLSYYNHIYDLTGLSFEMRSDRYYFSPIRPKNTIEIQNRLIKNPIRGFNGEAIPIIETATVKNVDADGNLDKNGGYIKFSNDRNSFTESINWKYCGDNCNADDFDGSIFGQEGSDKRIFGQIDFVFNEAKTQNKSESLNSTNDSSNVLKVTAPNTGVGQSIKNHPIWIFAAIIILSGSTFAFFKFKKKN